jgi:heterodisulfide reductase subunit C
MKHSKAELRGTKTDAPPGLMDTIESLYQKTKQEHPDRVITRCYYCGVCGNSVRLRKRDNVWVHEYSPLEFYSDFLQRQADHDIVVKTGKVWIGKIKW